ncbi:chorismate-binding protein [Ekhidna sp.]
MTELQNIIEVDKLDQLINKLELAGIAFALWRMPNSTDYQLIISLEECRKVEEIQLEDLDAGFIVNEFKDNHPVSPYYIQADIVIKNEELSVNPRVTDSQIDDFKAKINSIIAKEASLQNEIFENPIGDFNENVQEAVNAIKDGLFEKVVLSRYKDLELGNEFSTWEFYKKISNKYHNAFVSVTFIPDKGLWIGATPELLLSDDKNVFKTVSLAGTKKLSEDQNLSEIAWTQKEIEEQAFVSRYIINCFKKLRLREFHEHGPKTIKAGSLAHLKTEFVVNYNEVSFDRLSDQMMELLHPTSAVCGMPIRETKPWIERIEGYNRELYSGFLGPVNSDGATSLFVNLRCVRIKGNIARFYAGAGITEDSNPQREFEETEMKMSILGSLIDNN